MRIALVGRAGTGKSTAAAALAVSGFRVVSLGDRVWRVANEVAHTLGAPAPAREDRALLAAFAEALEKVTPGWLAAGLEAGGSAVVDGVRRPSEVAVLRAQGWRIVGVRCAESARLARLAGRGDHGPAHCVSEAHTDEVKADEVWVNDLPTQDAWRARVLDRVRGQS